MNMELPKTAKIAWRMRLAVVPQFAVSFEFVCIQSFGPRQKK